LVAIVGGGTVEVGEAWLWWRWTHRRRPAVGVETLVGRVVDVREGWTEVVGERWRVSGVESGPATVVAVEGLTLVVERCD
jgi:membrane protein implicated in regulation of membrane protease activity